MKNRKILIGMALTASLFMAAPVFSGESTAGTKIGVLTCDIVPGSGYNLIIHSTADVTCKYDSTDASSTEYYIGETGIGLGINLQYDAARKLVFTVLAADTKRGNHKLAGKYIGAGGSASVGVGVGAQVLVGGGDKSISLQPVIEGSKGIGAAAGVTYLYLQKK
ncbi:MAG: DUF992 domain-containing protein [Mariprofundus sp.]|nr:DUF992 domain-containing protein [Mariprofundus sp.]